MFRRDFAIGAYLVSGSYLLINVEQYYNSNFYKLLIVLPNKAPKVYQFWSADYNLRNPSRLKIPCFFLYTPDIMYAKLHEIIWIVKAWNRSKQTNHFNIYNISKDVWFDNHDALTCEGNIVQLISIFHSNISARHSFSFRLYTI